jgi:outer membrane protein assembly factor BamB
MIRVTKHAWLLVPVLFALSACGGNSAKKENIEPPTPLAEFTASVNVERVWSATVGKGAGLSGAQLQPALANGRLYAASISGEVLALDANTGRRLWKAEVAGASGGPGTDGSVVVVGTIDGAVVALEAGNGSERWRARVSSEVIIAPVVSAGRVLLVANDGRVYCLDAATGSQRWAVDRGVPALSLRGAAVPIVLADRVIVGTAGGKVVALALEDGRPLWEQTVGVGEGRTDLERMVDIDGRMAYLNGDLFVAGYSSAVQALTAEGGRILWSRDLSSVSGLAASRDAIFVAASDGTVWALDRRTGGALWKNEALMHRMLSVPVLQGDYVVVGDLEGYLHWLRREDGSLAARSKLGAAGFGSGLVVDGDTLYAQGREGALGAFRLR